MTNFKSVVVCFVNDVFVICNCDHRGFVYQAHRIQYEMYGGTHERDGEKDAKI